MYKNIFFVIIGFLIINIFSLNAFYENYLGKSLYELENYSGSILNFQKSGNINGVYNESNTFYKQGNFQDAIKGYKSILGEEKIDINFRINHNIGNSFYRIGEKQEDEQKRIENFKESVNFYTDALNIKYDEETKQNLDFVLKKINQDDSNQDKKQDSKDSENKENQEQTGSGTTDDKQDGNKNGEEKSEEGLNENSGNKNGEGNELSEEQSKALKEYQEALKEEQKNNNDSFNKVYSENNSNDPFSDFFNDPFFNNDLLNSGNGEKDW